MPIDVENDLTVRGKTADIARFIAFMAGVDRNGEGKLLNENVLIPYPEEFRKQDEAVAKWWAENSVDGKSYGKLKDGVTESAPKDGFNSGGYEWSIANWGTKWGMYDQELVDESEFEDEKTLTYGFRSAWSPPTPLIKAMGEKFPELEIELRYFEGGAGFNGLYRMKNGLVDLDAEGKYFGDRGG